MNHSYRDYSKLGAPLNYIGLPLDIDSMSFSQKVHHMLSKPGYEHCISWMPHGRAFKIHRPIDFEREVCPAYFGHGRYSSFLRSLNNYGFKHISKGPDRNCKFLVQSKWLFSNILLFLTFDSSGQAIIMSLCCVGILIFVSSCLGAVMLAACPPTLRYVCKSLGANDIYSRSIF